jgi:dethiobiotin synthetase
MTRRLIVAGTDTDVGKTVFAAALVGALEASYWKPVQCGLEGGTDSETVARLSGGAAAIFPEAYRLQTPASPHLAAERQGVEIDVNKLDPPEGERMLVIEPAGGLMVPLTRDRLQIDMIARWQAPVVLCARTTLGTINHTLLSVEALQQRDIEVLGVAFIGDEHPDNERTIAEMAGVRRLGRLPRIDPLDAETLRAAFAQHFDVADFRMDAA